MSDLNDVRIPLPREDAGRRRINAVVLATLGAAAIALGATYYLVPRADRASRAAAGMTQVAIIQESPATSKAHGRAERLVITSGSVMTEQQYRAASGVPASYDDVLHARSNAAFAGKLLRIDGAAVQTVPGDKIFTIGASPDDSVLVKMNEPTNPGHKGEHELVIRPGDAVFVVGRLLPIPSTETLRKWGLNEKEEEQVGNRAMYLKATLVSDPK